MNYFKKVCYIGMAALYLFTNIAAAGVTITGTRVVLSAESGETTVSIHNKNPNPVLVQSWIDDGNANATPESAKTPFLITPPMLRLDTGRDQTLQVFFTPGEKALPTDRESLFWFNLLEIPPKPKAEEVKDKSYMQLALRSRLKLFYRPAGLSVTSADAIKTLTFAVKNEAGKLALVIHNPSPYYITLAAIQLGSDAALHPGGMVAPFADLHLPTPYLQQLPPAGTPIQYTNIDDFGAGRVTKGNLLL